MIFSKNRIDYAAPSMEVILQDDVITSSGGTTGGSENTGGGNKPYETPKVPLLP